MAEPSSLGYWLRRFLQDYATAERNLSPNTRASYRDMLVLLLPFIAKEKRTTVDKLAVTDLTIEGVRAFLAHLERDRKCGTATRNQRLASLRALARFVGAHSPEHVEWSAQIRMVPVKKGVRAAVTYLEKSEMDAILAAPDRSTPQGARDYALLLFLYNSGARVSEAVALTVADIDWHHKSVRVLGKGSKERRCPLWSETIEHLRQLTQGRAVDMHVFLNRRGEPLTRYGVHTLLERCVAKAEPSAPSLGEKRTSPHVIRHTTATHLLQAGVDINTIRAWLGHVSVDTTSIYAETDLATKKQALATLDRSGISRSAAGWSRRPDVMAFLRAL